MYSVVRVTLFGDGEPCTRAANIRSDREVDVTALQPRLLLGWRGAATKSSLEDDRSSISRYLVRGNRTQEWPHNDTPDPERDSRALPLASEFKLIRRVLRMLNLNISLRTFRTCDHARRRNSLLLATEVLCG